MQIDRRTDGQRDRTKVIVVFRSFAKMRRSCILGQFTFFLS